MARTDHSHIISEMREIAADDIEFPRLPEGPMPKAVINGHIASESQRKALIAAADLLEIHDSTGLNLHNAPGLLDFVEDQVQNVAKFYGVKVEPNGA